MSETVLVTGGCGYIGSHTILKLLQHDIAVIVLDNLQNSSLESLTRVGNIVGRRPLFVKGDIRDQKVLESIFEQNNIDAVIHFAGLKAVWESMNNPLDYYETNVSGTLALCKAMCLAGVFKLVFSSSATVYGSTTKVPIVETEPAENATNPYGRSKRMVEQILLDLAESDSKWAIAILRYFNPVGAHSSGMIGEDPTGVPNNLLPYISNVAIGSLPELKIFGNDYETHDGTGVRDYIHVMDLAEGHLKALGKLDLLHGAHVWNLGTGTGYSVFDVLSSFEKICGRVIPYRIVDRRPGDVGVSFSDTSKAGAELEWTARRDLSDMIQDTWRWQTLNPNGYKS